MIVINPSTDSQNFAFTLLLSSASASSVSSSNHSRVTGPGRFCLVISPRVAVGHSAEGHQEKTETGILVSAPAGEMLSHAPVTCVFLH